MEMDIYKVSLISIGLAISIVVAGVFMGIRTTEAESSGVYLTPPESRQEREVADQTINDDVSIPKQEPVTSEEEDLMVDLRFEGERNIVPTMRRNTNMSDSVFLVFKDDGINASDLRSLLRELKEANVNAAFFVSGRSLEENHEIWIDAIVDGHFVCNYTYSGEKIGDRPGLELIEDIKRWEIAAERAFGKKYVSHMKEHFPFFMFPDERIVMEERLLTMVERSDYRPIGWEISSMDMYDENDSEEEKAQAVFEGIRQKSEGGEIISLNLNSYTVVYTRQMIDSIREKGLLFRELNRGFRV